MDTENKLVTGAILAFALVLVLLVGFQNKISVFIVIAAVVLITFTSKGAQADYLIGGKGKDGELGEREKKLLIFHILTQLEKRNSMDLAEIAGELDVGIYALNDLVRFLDKHKVISVIYPPMKSLPVIRESDPGKSRKLRKQIYRTVAKKSLLGKPIKEEFTREVSEYLESRKRDMKS